jgi:hypothetical protein
MTNDIFCEECEEGEDCCISMDETCAMIRVYQDAKRREGSDCSTIKINKLLD